MDGYTFMKRWFAFAFENNSIVRPVHGALYGWLVELNNRKGWAAEFPAPAADCMQACGIHSYNTYKKALDELIEWGFVEMRLASKNQYTANVIALSISDKAPYKAIDKALTEHDTKHLQSTVQSTDSIIKLETSKQETTNSVPTSGAILFEKFFTAYGRPVARNKAEHVWFEDMNPDEWQKAVDTAPLYVKGLSNRKFHKSPDKWLEEKLFNDHYEPPEGDTVKFLNVAAGAYGTMPRTDWDRLHANNPNTTLQLVPQ